MAFLDNSGDIILDAVLTDTGRMRLAKGDGSFRITSFALGDDEINYALYNRDDSRGSAYYDLDILSTPIFEAFTNNISSLNSRLMTIASNTHFYLPVLKLSNLETKNQTFANTKLVTDGFLMASDVKTSILLFDNYKDVTFSEDNSAFGTIGIINGIYADKPNGYIKIDQGIDNVNVPPIKPIDPELKETQYLVEMDNRLIRPIFSNDSPNGAVYADLSYVDDDNIASYFFSREENNLFVTDLEPDTSTSPTSKKSVIAGARGTTLQFSLASKDDIILSDYLFKQIGTNVTNILKLKGNFLTEIRSINTTVRITGLTTGCTIEIPIVILKYIA